MQSLGRALRKVGERDMAAAGGSGRGMLYSTLPPRSPVAARLDRFARRANRLHLPQRAGLYASGAFLALSIGYGTVVGGHLPSVGQGILDGLGYVTARVGFAIDSVLISGHEETAERDIVKALGIDSTTSLLTFDPFAARQRLTALPWVKSGTVQKLFPNTLKVEIAEREAFALWQIGGMVSMVDRSGESIGMLSDQRFADLPLVVGFGANRAAADLIAMIEPHPRLAARLRAAVRVADRRWNLLLDNGVEVRLPEEDAAGAVAELARLDQEAELMSRDIVAVDMRLADRIVVRLSEHAAVQRRAKLEAAGAKKRKGANI